MKAALNFKNFRKGVNNLLFTTEKKIHPYLSPKETKWSEFALLSGLLGAGLYFANTEKKMHAWIYRDDIGAPNGIHGYEEMVNSVGGHHGHYHWPQEKTFSTFNSAT